VGVSAFKDLEWLEALLKHAQGRGLKMYDVMAPHYILRGTGRPEDYLENLKYARQLADRYGLVLWNGENGGPLGSFHNIYPNFTFQPDEKGYANGSMREYLLHKMYGVEHVNICFACEWVPPRGIFYFEYESCLAGRFYGAGGFLKPYAVAHAALARLLDGSRFEQQVDLRLKDGWCLVFRRGDENLVAAWMVEDKAAWNLSLPDGVTYVNIVGASRQISGPQRLIVSGEPFYLVAKGEAGAKLVNAIKESRLVPDTLIAIERISFGPDRKGFDVQLRNFTGAPLKVDSITFSTGKPQLTVSNVALAADDTQTIRLTPPTPVERSVMAEVTAVIGDKSYKKEEFVFYPSLESARASGYLIATKARRRSWLTATFPSGARPCLLS